MLKHWLLNESNRQEIIRKIFDRLEAGDQSKRPLFKAGLFYVPKYGLTSDYTQIFLLSLLKSSYETWRCTPLVEGYKHMVLGLFWTVSIGVHYLRLNFTKT